MVVALLAGCGPSPSVETDLSGLDAEAAGFIADLASRVRAEPRSAVRRAELGMAYEVHGLHDAARSSYQQAIALQPGEPRWRYYLAIVRSLLGDIDGAVDDMLTVAKMAEDRAGVHLYLGTWLLDLGRPKDALAAFRTAVSLDAASSAAAAGQAKALMAVGDFAATRAVLDGWLERHPNDISARHLLAQVLARTGDLAAARALGGAAPADAPRWGDPWNGEKAKYIRGYGVVLAEVPGLLAAQRYSLVIDLLERHQNAHGDDVQLLNNLSVAYRKSGRPDKAFELLKTAISARPDFAPLHLNISADYERLGNLAAALQHAEQASDLDPQLAEAHERVGQLLFAGGRPAEARGAFERARAAGLVTARLWLGIAGTYAAESDWLATERSLEHAVAAEPALLDAHLALANARAAMRKWDSAAAALNRAAQLAPSDHRVRALRKYIAQHRTQP